MQFIYFSHSNHDLVMLLPEEKLVSTNINHIQHNI